MSAASALPLSLGYGLPVALAAALSATGTFRAGLSAASALPVSLGYGLSAASALPVSLGYGLSAAAAHPLSTSLAHPGGVQRARAAGTGRPPDVGLRALVFGLLSAGHGGRDAGTYECCRYHEGYSCLGHLNSPPA
jgi:hypothetical protein